MPCALVAGMHIKSLEEFEVFQRALEAAAAISAIVMRPCFRSDLSLRNQLRDASSRIPSHISEGFGQKTDRHFAHYLYIGRGSCNEMQSHLAVSLGRGFITDAECKDLCDRYAVIGRQLTRLLQHLEREDRPRRG
jgi:four helix bundle protein